MVLLIPLTSPEQKEIVYITDRKVRGLLTVTLFHILWIFVQKDALQILTCWRSSVAWLVLLSHVILLGNVDQ